MRLFRVFGYLLKPFLAERDAMRSMSYFAIWACLVKFFLEGMTFHFFGDVITFSVSDPMTYGAILTPILGAQATRDWKSAPRFKATAHKVDNPDQG